MQFCTACGTALVSGQTFCTQCGARADTTAGSQTPQPPAEVTAPTVVAARQPGRRGRLLGIVVVVAVVLVGVGVAVVLVLRGPSTVSEAEGRDSSGSTSSTSDVTDIPSPPVTDIPSPPVTDTPSPPVPPLPPISDAVWSPDYVLVRSYEWRPDGSVALTYDRIQPGTPDETGGICRQLFWNSDGWACAFNNQTKKRTVGVIPEAVVAVNGTEWPLDPDVVSQLVVPITTDPAEAVIVALETNGEGYVDRIVVAPR